MSRIPLSPGDTVAVVAPSGPFPEDRYQAGLAVLRARGYVVREGRSLRHAKRYLAATDDERASDLVSALDDPEVKAVFAARGGYGAMRVLPKLSLHRAVARGLPLVGFSDVTALHCAVLAAGGRSVHGPVVTRLGEEPPHSLERLFALLESREPPAPLVGETVVPGEASGKLVGGCLSVLSRLVGTPFLPSLRGAVLLLEDVGEKPYRLDRMWTHLALAGLLDDLAGVALGEFTGCEEPGADYAAADVLAELVRELGKPTVAKLPVGHGAVNLAVPLGARVRLEGGRLVFEEGL